MMDKISVFFKNSLVKTSFVYTIINFINKAFPFMLLPLLTRTLSPSDYGEYSLFRASTNILLPIIGLNLSEYVMKNYFSEDEYDFDKKLSVSILINLFLFGLIFFLVGCINSNFLVNTFDIHKDLILSSVVVALCTSMNNIERNILRCQNNTKLFSVLVIGQTMVFFISILILYYNKILTLSSLIRVEVFTYLLFAIVSFCILRYKFEIKLFFEKKLCKIILVFCIPLVLNSFLAYIFSLSDRFIIAKELDAESVGYYSVSFQLVSVLQILAVAFNTSWTPYIYKRLKENLDVKSIRSIQSKVMLFFIGLGIIYYIFLIFGFDFIVGEKYTQGFALVKWLLIGTLFQLFYWLNSTIIIYAQKNWSLTLFSFFVTLFSVVANFVFIKKYGIESSAIIYCISWVILASLTYIKSKSIVKEL
ncbi:lipopolysaccharide biosynthesis protein [Sphingobacterium faecium]|uniref:lipopolysaccharide biosynthesis protein n=1 Tax=Sphingobacterium faecium TaxID=34087 RepID=UPI003209F4AC